MSESQTGSKPRPPPIKPRLSLQKKKQEQQQQQLQQQQQQEQQLNQEPHLDSQRLQTHQESEETLVQLKPCQTIVERLTEKSGFLYKTGPSQKRFRKRWFVLSEDVLSYYAEPLFRVPKAECRGSLELNDILLVGVHVPSEKIRSTPTRFQRTFSTKTGQQIETDLEQFPAYFCVGISSQQGRVFIIAAESLADSQTWRKNLAEAIGPPGNSILRNRPTPECVGYLHVKLGISGIWTTCFVVLENKRLIILTEFVEEVSLDGKMVTVDLRKVTSVSYTTAHQISSCGTVKEIGQPVCLNRPYETTVYIQGDYKSHTDFWYHNIQKAWTVPVSALLHEQLLTPGNIPIAIDKCLNFISTYGGLKEKGIYKNPGQQVVVKTLISHLKDSNTVWDWHIRAEDGYTVHDVATALKLYLLSLPECILTEKLVPEWIDNNKGENRDERLKGIKILLKSLPLVNFNTLKKLICHFCCLMESSEENQMNIINIANTFGSVFLFSSKSEIDSSSGMDILCDILSSYVWLFDVKPEELEKEKKIQRTLVCLRETRIRSSKPAGDILVGVYVYSKEWGVCLNVPLSATMTSEELIMYVKEKGHLKDDPSKVAVFEVVCDDQLERILHYSEVVLGVTLSWTTNWPADDAKKNYLIVKCNELYDKIGPLLNQTNARTSTFPLSLFSELKFSDINSGKTFKKVLFEFIGARLNVYKDAKADRVIGQWNIEDITWYLGAESKRNAPNKYSITFVERYKSVMRSKETSWFVGRVVCCNNEDEYHQWIAGMIMAEYPNGVYAPKVPIDLLS